MLEAKNEKVIKEQQEKAKEFVVHQKEVDQAWR